MTGFAMQENRRLSLLRGCHYIERRYIENLQNEVLMRNKGSAFANDQTYNGRFSGAALCLIVNSVR